MHSTIRYGCWKDRGEIALDVQSVRGGKCGDVNPEHTTKLADGAIEYSARVVVVMCAELDDAPIKKGDRFISLPFPWALWPWSAGLAAG